MASNRRSGRLVLVLALAAAGGCRTVDRGLSRAHLPCGLYRWPVKTLSDPDSGSIHRAPIDTTIAPLLKLPRPERRRRRERSTYELYVFRVRAILAAVRPQVDQDYHLLLRDPDDPSQRLIAEIPSPSCASDEAEAAGFGAARRLAKAIGRRRKPALVEVTGVGFFDALHKRGGSENGFELHPVLRLLEVETSPPPEIAGTP